MHTAGALRFCIGVVQALLVSLPWQGMCMHTAGGKGMCLLLRYAASNTRRGVESCGILAGVLDEKNACFQICTLIIPKQEGTSDTVQVSLALCKRPSPASLLHPLDRGQVGLYVSCISCHVVRQNCSLRA